MLLLIVVAFVAGLVTAVSPCVLPILPIVLATGAGGDRRRPYLVIAGLIASFSFFTLASVQLISALHLPSSTLRDVAIVVIGLFGWTLVVPALAARFERVTARVPAIGARLAHAGGAGVAGGLLTGVGLGLVWTPCAGPILGAITSLAVTAPGSSATLALVVAYSIGAGLPLLAIALGGRAALARLHLRSASWCWRRPVSWPWAPTRHFRPISRAHCPTGPVRCKPSSGPARCSLGSATWARAARRPPQLQASTREAARSRPISPASTTGSTRARSPCRASAARSCWSTSGPTRASTAFVRCPTLRAGTRGTPPTGWLSWACTPPSSPSSTTPAT